MIDDELLWTEALGSKTFEVEIQVNTAEPKQIETTNLDSPEKGFYISWQS